MVSLDEICIRDARHFHPFFETDLSHAREMLGGASLEFMSQFVVAKASKGEAFKIQKLSLGAEGRVNVNGVR